MRLRDFIASRSRGGWTPPAASLTVLSKDAEPVRWGQGTAFQSFNLC